jgi:peptide/nickel transport system substrate-binding protein
MIRRRQLLAAAVVPLARPAIVRAESARVLTFIPQADLAVLDPIWTTAYVSRNAGFLVYDTLFGSDSQFQPQPQMLSGSVTEDDGKTWRLTLRPGLKFHDGAPVLARDCVASIKRWGARDPFGQTLLSVTDELSAGDDKTIVFKLKKPFPLLPAALGKPGSNVCFIMPERLASTSPFIALTEMVGSGPYRFNASERVAGSRVVFERNEDYVPRESGAIGWSAGPKHAHFDRVVWNVIPDAATSAATLQTGEADWWELPTVDLVPLLKRDEKLMVEIKDPTGQIGCLRMNELIAPFDNPAIRRVVLDAVNQEDYMIAVAGTDPTMRHTPCGYFTPNTPMASGAGLDIFTQEKNLVASKAALTAAGYKGEKIVLLAPTDFPILKAMADVGADMLQKIGFNVDYQAMDWGIVVQRRAKKDPVEKGGWSVFHTFWSGADQLNPAVNAFLRAQGASGFIGWPNSPKIEAMRNEWLFAPDDAAQKTIAAEVQQQALEDVPYVPVGQNFFTCAYSASLKDMPEGFPIFWNVRRT